MLATMPDYSQWDAGVWIDAISSTVIALASLWLMVLLWIFRLRAGQSLIPAFANLVVRFAGFFGVTALLFGSLAVANFFLPKLWYGDYLHAVTALMALMTLALAISCTPLPRWISRVLNDDEH